MKPQNIKEQYSQSLLFERIIDAISESGDKIRTLTRNDTSVYDEFHVRGRGATAELIKELDLSQGHKVIDVGCGLGGPCRMIADTYGCDVTGLDLSPEHIRTATLLSRALNMSHRTLFVEGDALNMLFAAASFDVVLTQHVQMNIDNKAQFYSEIHRILRPGGKYAYYEVFAKENNSLLYPLPWADTPTANLPLNSESYIEHMQRAGFSVIQENIQTQQGIDFLTTFLERCKKNPKLLEGQKIIMGNNALEKISNIYSCLIEGKLILQSGIWEK